jgi:hypothetical protein
VIDRHGQWHTGGAYKALRRSQAGSSNLAWVARQLFKMSAEQRLLAAGCCPHLQLGSAGVQRAGDEREVIGQVVFPA